ncbi:MAG: patatin-like phospholipase family protein [Anaerolineae bacterium]|jgi:NTE family protein|nr:patatin-like phospholipase family protein [Anaerolineae bacterium]
MKKCLAFVLGGGGARGALQVGALRALLEAGIVPDLLVGTSIGAVNAVGLGLWGVDLDGVTALEQAWQAGIGARLMDPRLSQLTLRTLFYHPDKRTQQRVANFFALRGITHDLCFNQISGVRLGLVGADLESGEPVIYGEDASDSIVEGLLASIALPPWFAPIEKDGQTVVDGGALSNLPIEPAMKIGATEIIALDIDTPDSIPGNALAFFQAMGHYMFALSRRHIHLETALAEAQGVPVYRIELKVPASIPTWDFRSSRPLIRIGYEIASEKISTWMKLSQPAPILLPRDMEKQPAMEPV